MADRTVYFAKITRQPGLWDAAFKEWLLEVIDPKTEVTRYRRTWRFSRPHVTEDTFVAGRLGYVKTTAARETIYDETVEDFFVVEGIASEGSFSNFVVDTASEIVAFEERPPDIEVGSFVNNFRAILASHGDNVRLELLADPAEFPAWASTVDRVVEVSATVHRPNPGWNEDAGAIREVVEQSDAEEAHVRVEAPEEGSIDPNAQWIRGAIGQVAEHGQGKVAAVGIRGEDKVRWRSGQSRRTATMPETIVESVEGVVDWMISRLRSLYGR